MVSSCGLATTARGMSFVGQGVAAMAAWLAANRTHAERVQGGQRGPAPTDPTPFQGSAEAAARQRKNYDVRSARQRQRVESRKDRTKQLERLAKERLDLSPEQIAEREKKL